MAATKHTHADTDATRYRVPPEPNRWPAIGLAVGVHALLLAFLFIGVSWQNNVPVAVEAEIWDVTTQTAAPPPPPPTPEPEPEPQPETPPPQPAPRAVEPPPPPPPPPIERPAPPKQPDIALEREKKRQEELKRKEEARAEREREQERERAEQQRADEKKAKDLAAKKERDLAEKKERDAADKKERAAAEKKEREAAEKKEREAADKKEREAADKKKKADAEKKKQDAADQKKRDAARADEMKRLIAGAGAGTAGSTGTAAQTTAPGRDKGYVAAITAKVKGNTSYAGDLDEAGNPTATFKVEQLPTGEIISVRKTKSSGIPAFDEAVEKGITKSSPLPKKKDGTVERSLEINFRMKDMQ